MDLIKVFLWIAPFLIIPAAYLLFRFKCYRMIRYWIYFALLFCAFLFDLTGISFRMDIFDNLLFMGVALSICEFCWYLTIIKSKIFLRIFFSCVLILYILAFHKWMFLGPQRVSILWDTEIVDSFKNTTDKYWVKEKEDIKDERVMRVFYLYKKLDNPFFEQIIGMFTVPAEYYKAVFSFKWRNTSQGVSVELIGDKDTLWTLGEGISNTVKWKLY